MSIWVILYTYSGWDGEIFRLLDDGYDKLAGDDSQESFLAFSSKEKANQYLGEHNKYYDNSLGEYTIHEVTVR